MGGAAYANMTSHDMQIGFNAARGFVGGAAAFRRVERALRLGFNAARGFVGGAAAGIAYMLFALSNVSMPHAALWVVQLIDRR